MSQRYRACCWCSLSLAPARDATSVLVNSAPIAVVTSERVNRLTFMINLPLAYKCQDR